jgi:hypothetical protein
MTGVIRAVGRRALLEEREAHPRLFRVHVEEAWGCASPLKWPTRPDEIPLIAQNAMSGAPAMHHGKRAAPTPKVFSRRADVFTVALHFHDNWLSLL